MPDKYEHLNPVSKMYPGDGMYLAEGAGGRWLQLCMLAAVFSMCSVCILEMAPGDASAGGLLSQVPRSARCSGWLPQAHIGSRVIRPSQKKCLRGLEVARTGKHNLQPSGSQSVHFDNHDYYLIECIPLNYASSSNVATHLPDMSQCNGLP